MRFRIPDCAVVNELSRDLVTSVWTLYAYNIGQRNVMYPRSTYVARNNIHLDCVACVYITGYTV